MAQEALRQLMTDKLSPSDLRVLCYDLEINYDEQLQGSLKSDKVVALLVICERKRLGSKLVNQCRKLHPEIVWPDWQESTQSGTDVLKSSIASAEKTQPDQATEAEQPLLEKSDEALDDIVRYLMSERPKFNSTWFARRREFMETSYTAISSASKQLDLLVTVPYMAKDTIESCQQLSSQAKDLMKLLQKVGIGPRSPHPKRELHNNLYLIDERAAEAIRNLEQIINAYYAEDSPQATLLELHLGLKGLKSSTEYTLLWLNRTIAKLDNIYPNY